MDCWQQLGIAETTDIREIKRAYAKLIKQNNPEESPKEFQVIREAYDEALAVAEYLQQEAHADDVAAHEPIAHIRQVAEQPAATMSERDQVRDTQVQTIDAALTKLVSLLQRDDGVAVVFCRTTLREEFFQALDVRYEFEGRLLIALLQNDLLPFAFLKYLAEEFQWDINLNRSNQMVIGHFDADARFGGAFHAVAYRYLEKMIRDALRVHVRASHSWLDAARFDQLDTLLFTEGQESALAEFCKDKQNRELLESAMSFLAKHQYVTNHSSFVPWKTLRWLTDHKIANRVPPPKPSTTKKESQFPYWVVWIVLFVIFRIFISVGKDASTDQPKTSGSPNIYTFSREKMDQIEQWQREAAAGDAQAQYSLGLEYQKGTVLTKDRKKALEFLQRAVDQQYAPALEALGIMYYKGQDVAQDYKTAIDMLAIADAHDRADATYWLAIAYDEGKAVKRNVKQSRQFLERAIELGSIDAMRTKGFSLLHGRGAKKDVANGVRYLEQAADKGDINAAYQLAYEYLSGEQLEINYEQAHKWLDALATRHIPIAQMWLSQLYEKGLGVPKDVARAKQLLTTAKRGASPNTINEFSWSLVTYPNQRLRNSGLAMELMEKLLSNPNNSNATWLDTLAAAYAAGGQFDRAIQTQQDALNKLPADTAASERREYEARLKLYQSHNIYAGQ